MTDQERTEASLPESDKGRSVESSGTAAAANPGPGSDQDGSAPGQAAKSEKLTKEEQMALYEKDLKENDWGHQPC
jgi:hypothetical protein